MAYDRLVTLRSIAVTPALINWVATLMDCSPVPQPVINIVGLTNLSLFTELKSRLWRCAYEESDCCLGISIINHRG